MKGEKQGLALKLPPEKPPVLPITLQAVNHSPIPTYSQISRSMDLELRRDFTVADLPHSILGSDILHHINLLVVSANDSL